MGRVGFPGFLFLLGLGVCDGPVGGEYRTFDCIGQGCDVTFCCTWLDAAETEARLCRGEGGSRTAPTGGRGAPPSLV